MKKSVKQYVVAWVILVAIFNVVVFVTPSLIDGYNKFGGAFWSGYIFIMVALVGNLVCALYALKATTKERLFLNLPIIKISYTALVLSFVVGIACMIIPNIPNWVGVVLCALILGFSAISVIKANVAAETVANIDERVAVKTNYMRMLTTEAESLVSYAKTDENKKICKQVYEAIRYSDPVSSETLNDIENEMYDKLTEFKTKLKNDECNQEIANEILTLVKERNNKCKLLK